jgi:hypothetical protein
MIKNGFGRKMLPGQQPPRAVQVGKYRVQQLSSLHEASLESRPLVIIEDERQRIQSPRLRLR